MPFSFTDSFLQALGAWQNGWREIQSRREELAKDLCREAALLPSSFRQISAPCFRKRFLHKGELVDLIISDEKDEGIASWTTDLRFAERLKGLTRPDAVSAAIFKHLPEPSEIIVSLPALWADAEFRNAVKNFSQRGGEHAAALNNFRDTQCEVVLRTPLRGSAIIALSGASSPFDDLCDRAGIPEEQRDIIFKKLIDSKSYPGDMQYIDQEATQRVIAKSIAALNEKLAQLANPSQ